MARQSLTALTCAAGLLAFVALTSNTARADDLDKMQGTWRVVSAQVGGEVAGPRALRAMKVSIDGHKLVLEEGNKVSTVHFFLDPDSHQVDFFKDVNKKEKLWEGIYEFSGSDLKLCWGANGAARPKQMGVKPGTDQRYYIISPK